VQRSLDFSLLLPDVTATVQALLGHSSSEITRDVYLHSIHADARAAVQKVEDFLIRPKLTQAVEIAKPVSSLIQ
jgi:integrase